MDAIPLTHLGLSLLAGSLTTLSPCVFPILPLVIGGAVQANRLAPVAKGIGMATSFALIGLLLGALGPALGIDSQSLSLAFLIFLSMFWVALGLLSERGRGSRDVALKGLQRTGFWLTILVGYMVMTGGFVAGIRAGKAYNSFPLMNGHVLPPESFIIDPWYLNFFNNMALVQFAHRLGAWLLVFLMPWFWWKIRNAVVSSTARMVATLLLAGVLIQIALGIATLLLAVPVGLGAAHQGGAMVVLGLLLWLNHELRVARVSGDSI